MFETLQKKISNFLTTTNLITKHLPFVLVVANKITQQYRTYKIVCVLTLVEGVQKCILLDISPCGTFHKEEVLGSKIKKSLTKIGINVTLQLNGLAFDGHYFDLKVDQKFVETYGSELNVDFLLPTWYIAHKLECALRDVRKTHFCAWLEKQTCTVGEVMKNYKWDIWYKELIGVANELGSSIFNPKSCQDTQFGQSEVKVYETFVKDFPLFYTHRRNKRSHKNVQHTC